MGYKSSNDGIQILGGTVHAQQMTAGQGALSVTIATSDPLAALEQKGMQDLVARLRSLGDTINGGADRIPRIEEVRAKVRSVAEELTKPEPNRGMINAFLGEIAQAGKSIAGIVGSIEAVKAAIQVFF